ncbi:PAS domain-containing protein [Kordiimonas marina]|uniref:PAS domain-containing protein n=1 Tax=Kordiimonas marina TaxID=2872312 RepID=UPI001FF41EDF|nr:PAS domain-containing protein [Kordiimonas marina]MCJ9427582.1 PAS domain-containing protein [Kordiimonas marina]
MPVSGVLEQLLHYWQALPREVGAIIPARAALHPSELREYLPRLALMKRLDRYDIAVSMIGTSTDQLWQAPIAGINAFDLTSPTARENTARLYSAILDQPTGVIMRETVRRREGKNAELSSIYLPLADEHGSPSYIVTCSAYEHRSRYDRINDRLMPDHQKVSSVEFIDIGSGIPEIEFERPVPRPATRPEQRWWERFMPAKPRPAEGTWHDA